MKKLVVNADDFGFTRDVNEGIVEAHVRGILTAATLMANGRAFLHGVQLAKEHSTLDVGCHLVLVGGQSLLTGCDLPRSVHELTAAVCLRRMRIFDELSAQVERILEAGIQPTHLDTHKHTHLLPPVLDALARVGERYGIRWIRRPFDFPLSGGVSVPFWKRATSRSLAGVRSRFHGVLSAHGCRSTDHFAGFQLTGHLRSAELISLLHALPEGTTEFMCHPGRCTAELMAARTRLKESRARELDALISPEVREVVTSEQIILSRYCDLT